MVRIITDSVSSIPKDIVEELGIETVSMIINRDGVEYAESETDLDKFYEDIYEMSDNIPTSSQPPLTEIHRVLESAAEASEDILGIFISSRMSGTFETFAHVAKETKQAFPSFKYAIADSMSNCMEEGWQVLAAAKAAKSGATLEECVETCKKVRMSTRFVFAPESLMFLEKGGRIGKAAALLGHVIKIAPVLTVSDGEASTLLKTRTYKKALQKIIETFKEDVAECGLKNIAVHYIGSKAPAEKWAKEHINPLVGIEVRVIPASPVIGVHTGPSIGLVYECEKAIPNKFPKAFPELIASYC